MNGQLDTIQRLAKLEAQNADHERRISKNEDMTMHIHELNANVKNMITELKELGERIDKGLTRHGERLGALESKGSKKFESIIATIVTVIVTAVIMYFVGNA